MGLRLKKFEKILLFSGSALVILGLIIPLLTYGIIRYNYGKSYINTTCYYNGYNITNQACDGQEYTGVLLYYLYYNNNTIDKSYDMICSDDINDIQHFFNNYTQSWKCWYSSHTNNVIFKPITGATGMIVGGSVIGALYISFISIYVVIKERKNDYQIIYCDNY